MFFFFQFLDSFSNAKIKLKKVEYQSDIDSPYNTDEKKKQRRDKAKIHFSDNESNNENQIYEKRRRVKPKILNLPALPQIPVTAMKDNTKIQLNDTNDNEQFNDISDNEQIEERRKVNKKQTDFSCSVTDIKILSSGKRVLLYCLLIINKIKKNIFLY